MVEGCENPWCGYYPNGCFIVGELEGQIDCGMRGSSEAEAKAMLRGYKAQSVSCARRDEVIKTIANANVDISPRIQEYP